MTLPCRARPLACSLALVMGSACSSVPEPAPAPVEAGEFLDWIERVYVEAELAREQLIGANQALQLLVNGGYEGKPMDQYQAFVASIQSSTNQTAALQATIEPLRRAAKPFFAAWVADLNSFASSSLWQRSQARLMAARRRYDLLIAKLEALEADHGAFNRDLRDHALFLRHDFNESSTAEIRDNVLAMDATARKLNVDYGNYLLAARSYLTASAPPREAAVAGEQPADTSPTPADAAASKKGTGK